MSDPRHLLLEIADCQIVSDIRSGNVSGHCCQTIVNSQKQTMFQRPEPWVGQIDRAPILFISSNPSFDEEEHFPDSNAEKWRPELVVDFFQNRFTSPAGWVKGLKVLHADGSYSKSWVRFWASARARAAEALQKKKKAVIPGVDFALTEVVHCKSKSEIGVNEAQDFCSARYLERILSVAAARVLIVYGVPAREMACRAFGLRGHETTNCNLLDPVLIGRTLRMVVFLPHPNAHGPKKTLEANLGNDLSLVHAFVKGSPE
jgi:hypothetical protein